MGSPNQLSFLPDDYLERKAQRRTNALCAIVFFLVVGSIFTAFSVVEGRNKKIEAEGQRIDDLFITEAKRIEQVKEMHDKQKRMAQQAELTASLLEKVPRSIILAEITNSLPAGVSLLDLNLDSRPRVKATATALTAYELKKQQRQAGGAAAAGAAAAATPAPEAKLFDVSLKVTGVARNDVQVAQFINKLTRSKLLRDVNLLITDEYTLNEEKVRRFQIEMMLDPNAEVQGEPKVEQASTSIEVKE